MRVLVTGGAGFIGSSIACALTARGDAVRVVDDLSTGRVDNLHRVSGDVEVIRGDIRDQELMRDALRNVDAIFHQAAVASVPASIADPQRCEDVNVMGTVRLLEAARAAGVQRIIFAASAAAYGQNPELPKHEAMTPEPVSPYAITKVAGEHYMRVYAELYGMNTLSLRYFNVFGPHQDPEGAYASVIPRFITAIARGGTPVVYGDGEQTRDFCYIDNVVAANLAALASPRASGQVINVANGQSTSLLGLLGTLGNLFGREVVPRREPERSGDVRHSRADISAARDLLGYEPLVTVEEGLRRAVEHYRAAESAGGGAASC